MRPVKPHCVSEGILHLSLIIAKRYCLEQTTEPHHMYRLVGVSEAAVLQLPYLYFCHVDEPRTTIRPLYMAVFILYRRSNVLFISGGQKRNQDPGELPVPATTMHCPVVAA